VGACRVRTRQFRSDGSLTRARGAHAGAMDTSQVAVGKAASGWTPEKTKWLLIALAVLIVVVLVIVLPVALLRPGCTPAKPPACPGPVPNLVCVAGAAGAHTGNLTALQVRTDCCADSRDGVCSVLDQPGCVKDPKTGLYPALCWLTPELAQPFSTGQGPPAPGKPPLSCDYFCNTSVIKDFLTTPGALSSPAMATAVGAVNAGQSAPIGAAHWCTCAVSDSVPFGTVPLSYAPSESASPA
jgi:hypothetical protein